MSHAEALAAAVVQRLRLHPVPHSGTRSMASTWRGQCTGHDVLTVVADIHMRGLFSPNRAVYASRADDHVLSLIRTGDGLTVLDLFTHRKPTIPL